MSMYVPNSHIFCLQLKIYQINFRHSKQSNAHACYQIIWKDTLNYVEKWKFIFSQIQWCKKNFTKISLQSLLYGCFGY